MPSYTFVSTANAFVLRGAVPVFVDIRPDTLNIDGARSSRRQSPHAPKRLLSSITPAWAVRWTIMRIARDHQLTVIGDAAPGLASLYKDRPLGSIGNLRLLASMTRM